MPDIRIEYASGQVAYCEVFSDRDEASAAMLAELYEPEHRLPAEWAAPELQRVWQVATSRTSRFRPDAKGSACLERDLIRVLGEMEAADETFPLVATEDKLLAIESARVRELFGLGVVQVVARPTKPGEEALVRLHPEGIIGPAELAPGSRYSDGLPRLSPPSGWRATDGSWRPQGRTSAISCWAWAKLALEISILRSPSIPACRPSRRSSRRASPTLWVFDVRFRRVLVWYPDRGWRGSPRWSLGNRVSPSHGRRPLAGHCRCRPVLPKLP